MVNKATYEELIPVWDEWEGYGAWDFYGMIVTDNFKRLGGDFQQYLLEGQTIVEWTTGFIGYPLVEGYKKFLTFNKVENQKDEFKSKVTDYAKERITQLIQNKI